jgi:PhnB protein
MIVNAYLNFNGQCEEAFKFYAQTLGGKIESMIPHEATPAGEHVPPEWQKKIMHARLDLGGQVLMGSDVPPGSYHPPTGFSVTINLKQATEAERIFNELADRANIQMPLQETFWAVRFGMLVDRFGIPWMINCEKAMEQSA